MTEFVNPFADTTVPYAKHLAKFSQFTQFKQNATQGKLTAPFDMIADLRVRVIETKRIIDDVDILSAIKSNDKSGGGDTVAVFIY